MFLFSGISVRPERLGKVMSEFLIMVVEVTSTLQKIMRSFADQRWVNLVFEVIEATLRCVFGQQF